MHFEASLGYTGATATVHLAGVLDEESVPQLRSLLEQAAAHQPLRRLILRLHDLESISTGGVRSLAFLQQHLEPQAEVVVDGATGSVRQAFRRGGLDSALTYLDERALFPGHLAA
ncbi:STAS domain-containing protein [Streptomyces lydicus]